MNFVPGIALIIKNKISRPGPDYDVQTLKRTLEKLNARVETVEFEADEEDFGKESLEKIVEEFTKRTDFSKYAWTAIALFSHGLGGRQILEGKKCVIVQKVLLNQLIDIDELNGKLKWLILQARCGLHDWHTASSDAVRIRERDIQKYYIKSYSSREGCLGYHHDGNIEPEGSVYINYLCENLDRYADTQDISTILRGTAKSVRSYYTHTLAGLEYLSQEARYETNLQGKKFFFTKGIVKTPSDTDYSVT